MLRLLSLIMSLCFIAAPCIAQADEVVVATGKTFLDKVFTPLKANLEQKNIHVKIDYSKPADALKKLEAGQAELAGASLAPEDWYKNSVKDGYTPKFKDKLVAYPISTEETIVIVNKTNSVTNLSKDQVKGLFTGKIQNWKEVGGTDAPVIVVWPRVMSGAMEIFSKKMLDEEIPPPGSADVPTISDTIELISTLPEGISIANSTSAMKNVKPIETMKVVRQLTLLSNGQPSAAAKKLLDYLMGEGKQYIK